MKHGSCVTSPNVAVVGVGYWGKNLARNFHELGALRSLCDAEGAVEDRCRSEYGGVGFSRDYAAVLADPAIDAVALATPAVTHFEMARAALAAGKDVFVEKPLAITVAEGAELVERAAAAGRILMVGHILRYHPAIRKLEELIRDGALGQLNYLYSNRLNIGKIRTEENILWSFAPHDISVILSLLGESPATVACRGGAYLNRGVVDVTLSQLDFANGVKAHIFVSWLHPVKEQRLVVVGSEQMAVFDDTSSRKLVLYPHKVEWKNRLPTAVKADGQAVDVEPLEPLRVECQHFLDSVRTRRAPTTDGAEGLGVLRVLDACQRSLLGGGLAVEVAAASAPPPRAYFAHASAHVDPGAEIGAGTKIWHFSHIMNNAVVGKRCVIGQNVNVDGGAVIGDNVKIQNNVSVYTGVVIEDDVFLGPSCVLTNVSNPRSQINRHALYETTRLGRGATVGANATILCGVTIGRYAFVGAGSVVTRSVRDFALVVGNPARQVGWMSRHGHRLGAPDADGVMRCPESGHRYRENERGALRCLDLDGDTPLPAELATGVKSYRQWREEAQGVRVPLLDLTAQYRAIKADVDAAIARVMESQHFILGPAVEACERAIAAYTDTAHAIGVTSGSDALLACLMAEEIGAGDEVITSPYTFFATAGAIARVGATPVFVDIDPATYNLDPARLESAVTARTRAIMPVHLYGQMADMDAVMGVADAHGLVVIEDAEQAIGAEHKGRRAGSVGHYGCFSFFPSKNLGAAGDAGMIVTGDARRAEKIACLRSHGSKPKYHHKIIGGNFRLDALQAAVVSAKLPHLDGWTAARRDNAERYDRLLAAAGVTAGAGGATAVVTPAVVTDRHIFNQYVIRVSGRDGLRAALQQRGVGTEVYYPVPMHLQECFAYLGHRAGAFPESEAAARDTLALPIYPELTDEQAMYVVDCIRDWRATGGPAA